MCKQLYYKQRKGLSPTKYYMDRSEAINCHMALSAMNYLLNNILYIFNIPDTEVVIILIILKRDDGLNHYLNIKHKAI
jgi:hypothetical protein